jgi:hypothetical protein
MIKQCCEIKIKFVAMINELRIGNMVHHKPEWSYRNEFPDVLADGFNFKWSASDWYAVGESMLSLDSIEPIPLTPELLDKLGLPKDGSTLGLKEIKAACFERNFDELLLVTVDGVHNTIVREVRYLHQLQNLYFALTGEELKVELL